jgi:hypothetical protein
MFSGRDAGPILNFSRPKIKDLQKATKETKR